MKIAFLQCNPRYLDVSHNLEMVEAHLDGADADLIVLPELFTSGYFFHSKEDVAAVAEPTPGGPTTERLAEWARTTGAAIVAGVAEREGDAFYNSAVVVSPEGYEGTYRKVHLYNEEKTFFEPGDRGLDVYELEDRDENPYRLGVMVCFDWYFPEAARTLALKGADIIAHPSNLVLPDCPRSMPIRALENHVFTVTANRYGRETKGEEALTFIGQSEICDPRGQILIRAEQTGDMLGSVEIDPAVARDRQLNAHNHIFEDRRAKQYAL